MTPLMSPEELRRHMGTGTIIGPGDGNGQTGPEGRLLTPEELRTYMGMGGDPLVPSQGLVQDGEGGLFGARVHQWKESMNMAPSGPAFGLVGSGIGRTIFRSLANSIDLTGEVVNWINHGPDVPIPLLTKSSSFLKGVAGLYEQAGRNFQEQGGFTDQQAKDLGLTGDIIGYVAPGLASWKMAGYASGLGRLSHREAVAQAARLATQGFKPSRTALQIGNIIQDMQAGAIFGFVFEGGTIPERAQMAATQMGIAGAFGAMTGALGLSIKGYKLLRFVGDAESRALMAKVETTRDPLTGLITLNRLDTETARLVNREMSEEIFMSQTEAGIRMAERHADYSAVVAGVMEMSRGNQSHAIVKNVTDLTAAVERVKKEFPDLKVEPMFTQPNRGYIVVGRQGLAPSQRSQFAATRRAFGEDYAMIPGQLIKHGPDEYVFVSMRGESQINVVRTADNAVTHVTPDEGTTPLFVMEPALPSDIDDIFVKDYISYLDEGIEKLAASRKTETVGVGQEYRDVPDAPGAAQFPEEVGKTSQGVSTVDVQSVVMGLANDSAAMARIREEVGGLGHIYKVQDITDGEIAAFASVQPDRWQTIIDGIRAEGFDIPSLQLNPDRVLDFIAEHADELARESADRRLGTMNELGRPITYEEALDEATNHFGIELNDEIAQALIAKKPKTLDQLINEKRAFILNPQEPFSHSEIVNQWAVDRGILPANLHYTRVKDSTGNAKRMYHGTETTFDRFSIAYDEGDMYGPGVFFTDDPAVASSYASDRPKTWPAEDPLTIWAEQVTNGSIIGKAGSPGVSYKIVDAYRLPRDFPQNTRMDAVPISTKTGKPIGPKIEIGINDVSQESLMTLRSEGPTPQVRTAFLDIRNPFYAHTIEGMDQAIKIIDFHNPEMGKAARQELASLTPESIHEIMTDFRGWYGYIERKLPGGGVNRKIAETGYDGIRYRGGYTTDWATEHDVWVAFSPEQILDAAHLPKAPKDLEAFKTRVTQYIRSQALDELDPRERALYKKLQDQLTTMKSSGPVDIKDLAHGQGFYYHKVENGTVLLRDMDSGTPILYLNDEAAKAGLQQAVRSRRDFLDNYGVPPVGGSGGWGGYHGGDTPDYGPFELFDDGDGPAGEMTKRVARILGHKPIWRNIIAQWAEIETATKVPLWSKVILPIVEGTRRMELAQSQYHNLIGDIFEGVKKNDILKLYEYMARIEGKNLTPPALALVRKEMGITAAQTALHGKVRKLLDYGGTIAMRDLGMSPRDYITDYISRIQPLFEKMGVVSDDELLRALESGGRLTAADKAFFLKARTGNLSQTERDLRLILIKYFNELAFDLHVREPWNRAYKYVERDPFSNRFKNPLGLGQLTPAMQQEAIKKLGGQTGVDIITSQMEEMLAALKGSPVGEHNLVTNFLKNMYGHLGVTISDEALKTWAELGLINMHGAIFGIRPRAIIRDSFSNMWFLGGRLGFRHMGRATEMSVNPAGYQKALHDGAIVLGQRGQLAGEIRREMSLEAPIATTGRFGDLVTKRMIAAGERVGKFGARISEKALTGYTSINQMLRVQAYWWQRLHTEEWLLKYQAGDITEKVFRQKGMPFMEGAKKDEFMRRLQLGNDEALSFIGREASDEIGFIYSLWAQPGWLQTSTGRMAGTFGVWPMWAREIYMHSMRNATRGQRAAFVARTGMVMSAMGILAYSTGTNLMNWISPGAWMTYAGGPFLDVGKNMLDIIGGTPQDRSRAWRDLSYTIPRLSFVGAAVLHDVEQSVEHGTNPEHQLYIMMLGRPQQSEGNYAMQYMLAPESVRPPASFSNLADAQRRRELMSEMIELPPEARYPLQQLRLRPALPLPAGQSGAAAPSSLAPQQGPPSLSPLAVPPSQRP